MKIVHGGKTMVINLKRESNEIDNVKLYANLHTHSTHTDGGYAPKEIVRAAKIEGYGAVAVTDHDAATGYPELKAACEKEGLECIFGVEFSAPSALLADKKMMEATFHIVGFDFDPEYPTMKKYLEDMSVCETEQTHVLFDRGVRLGKIKGIEWEEVLEYNTGITWLCNNHLWRAMLAKGLVTPSDRGWFWNELFADHRYEVPPYREFKKEYEIIQLIRDAGGIAIVAHPHEQLCHMDTLIEMGVEGLEVWHQLMTEEEKTQALKIAYEKGLYISGGSDHHGLCSGYYEDYVNLSDCPFYAPPRSYGTTEAYFNEIKNRKLNR